MRLDTEINVAVGCVNYLIEEVETLRKRVRELQIENDAYKAGLALFNKHSMKTYLLKTQLEFPA